jgi:excisionase family DNA binding protein
MADGSAARGRGPEVSEHAAFADGPGGAQALLERPAELLTAQEVADRLRVGKSTVYVLAQREGLPFITVGRLWRCPADKLEAWIASKLHVTYSEQ